MWWPTYFVDDTLPTASLGGTAHELWHVPGIVGLPLALLGVIAIYVRQQEEAGKVGPWGLVLLPLGMTIGAM